MEQMKHFQQMMLRQYVFKGKNNKNLDRLYPSQKLTKMDFQECPALQWLRLCTSNVGRCLNFGWGTRSHTQSCVAKKNRIIDLNVQQTKTPRR